MSEIEVIRIVAISFIVSWFVCLIYDELTKKKTEIEPGEQEVREHVRLAVRGVEESASWLIWKYDRLIWENIHKRRVIDEEGAYQEGCIRIIETARRFNKLKVSQGGGTIKFISFLHRNLDTAILDFRRKELRERSMTWDEYELDEIADNGWTIGRINRGCEE